MRTKKIEHKGDYVVILRNPKTIELVFLKTKKEFNEFVENIEVMYGEDMLESPIIYHTPYDFVDNIRLGL